VNFKQAIEALINGKKIRIKTWDKSFYWQLDEKGFVRDSAKSRPLIHKDMINEMDKWEIRSLDNESQQYFDMANEWKERWQETEKKRKYWETKYKSLKEKK